ncbi:MAG: C40 family peptidase [Actinobacteria bacterium]|nr:C40 family peptidase [Actinomycetota bacterium]
MPRGRLVAVVLPALAAAFASAVAAGATGSDWAAPQIRIVTQAGVLGSDPSSFAPQLALTQSALAAAIKATDSLQHAPVTPAATPPALTVSSSIGVNSTVGGLLSWTVDSPGRQIEHVDFAVDGVGVQTVRLAPFSHALDTRLLADGGHQLALNVTLSGGGFAIATWEITVANAPGSLLSPPSPPAAVPIAGLSLPPTSAAPAVPIRALYRAVVPTRAVTIKQLDAAIVGYLGLGAAARAIQATLAGAGLQPPPNTGTEAVARMLGLRLNHPAAADALELLPGQPATRAEAAWSFAQVLHIDDSAVEGVQQAADAFTLPALTPWQQRLLTTAISYVGYPYVWGGTSPTAETFGNVHAAGGFDCSGLVWRVVKLTPYAEEGRLASVLRGRTTYQMSGEVPRSARVPAAQLQPADVMFFGASGPSSSPATVDHAGLYLGNGWFVQSSDNGVTLLPFAGWYARSYAWGRRPLREAGLS